MMLKLIAKDHDKLDLKNCRMWTGKPKGRRKNGTQDKNSAIKCEGMNKKRNRMT